MRTRSQPLSPGGYQSLDDLPSRRRATRSASSAEPTTESQPEAAKTRKPRAKKSTTTKKTTRRRASKVAKSNVPDFKQTSPVMTEQSKALVVESADQQDICSDTQMAQSATDAPSRPPLSNIVNSRALGPQQATPIMRRRPRVPYANITARRRSNAGGRVVHTLFQLESLVNQSTITESAATDNEEEMVPIARDPVTPEPTVPTTPKTAPAASTGASPSWSRRIINNVSSRWSSFRGRISPRKSEGSQDLSADITAPSTSTTDLVATQPEETRMSTVTWPVSTDMEMAVVSGTPVAAASTPRRSSLSRTRLRPRAPSFDYSARHGGGFSKETLAKCYARSRNLPPSGLSNEALEVLASEQGNKRKRSSPESIPNPPGCSYGMHDDYFTFDDDDEVWAEEEKAQRAAEAAKAAKAAEAENEETVQPPLKKQRVAQESDQTRRRHVLRRETPRKAEQRPGYDRNRQTRLYQATHLSPVESSDFLSEGSQGPQTTRNRPNINTAPFTANTHGTFQTPGWDDDSSSDSEDYPSSGPRHESTTTPIGMYQVMPSSPDDNFPVSSPAPRIIRNPNPHGTFRTPYSSDDEDEDMDMDSSHSNSNLAGADPMDEDTSTPARTNDTTTETPTQNNEPSLPTTDPSPLTRVRNKAEQFKPKTPSRLREASRFSIGSTSSSPPTINETRATPFPVATPLPAPTPLPVADSDPMSIDGSSYLQIAKTGDDSLLDFGELDPEDLDSEDLENIDSKWLDKICPSGDFNDLTWPPLTINEIGICPKSILMDDAKTEEAVNYWQQLFESNDW
ncbi:hypothetical protein N7486_007039 [Penicillium sp. IBT 16267x]|nr:hypothetical protein N7486_007039 [Penicillium sp. IBT 16267x]